MNRRGSIAAFVAVVWAFGTLGTLVTADVVTKWSHPENTRPYVAGSLEDTLWLNTTGGR